MSNYSDLLKAVEQYYGAGSDEWKAISNYGIAAHDAQRILKQVPGVDIWVNAKGEVRSYNYTPIENITSGAEQAINSNVPATIKSFEIPSNSGIETVTSETGETVKQMTFTSGMKQAGNFVFGEVAPRVAAVATGITLGKVIDKALYSFDPDFWDEHGMSNLNPDTWGNLIGTDTAGHRVLNVILGTKPSGETQAYLDENALAYMAMYMAKKGVFDEGESAVYENDEIKSLNLSKYIDFPIKLSPQLSQRIISDKFDEENPDYFYTNVISTNAEKVAFFKNSKNNTGDGLIILASNNPGKYGQTNYGTGVLQPIPEETESLTKKQIHNSTIYCKIVTTNIKRLLVGTLNIPKSPIPSNIDYNIAYALLYGDTVTSGGIDGITNQDGAKTPDLSGADTPEEALNKLKEQYPDLWDKAISQDVVQPDGSVKTYTYVPVAMPDIDENGNPISSTSTQSNPQVQPDTSTKTLLDLITKIIQRDPPTNPPDTGDGDTPPVVPPSGSASSLYAIYNPTLSQINSFGAWLWSDNFVDQIKKLFNDPMQAIIGLHKVYAMPITGGSQTIKVGYLDSGVSARVVSNQYTTIDCGTVRLSEQFHNVFDYSPYTEVNLYLPFIGIVNINVSDVMRSSIHIVYHVDVLSGACLAEVKVTRDSAGGTLYQYAGNASVTLPISSGSYMGIVSAVAGVAGGIAGTIASGGAALPLLASSAGAMFNAHTRVEHSGGFSGNAGAMGGKIPYLIISRPQTEIADGFENYIGYPSNFTATIGSCTGFIKVIECHVENATATNSELAEINTMLQEGVIV